MHQKHQKHKHPTQQKHKMLQTKIKNALKKHLRGKKSHIFAYLHFCVFFVRKEKRIEKRKYKKEKSPHKVDVRNTDVPTTRFM